MPPYLVIVSEPCPDTALQAIRAWLSNDRRLGVRHIGARLTRPDKPAAPTTEIAHEPPATQPQPPASTSRKPYTQPEPRMQYTEDPNLPPLCDRELSEEHARNALDELDRNFVRGCEKCELCKQRSQTVFGDGHPRPIIAFIGEGPGAEEDRQGIPFVGRAGQLLTRMIAAMTLTREQVFIGNVVKCRPPGNRTPTPVEMQTCAPYLWRQLAILRPRVIVTLGRPAAQTLLATNTPIGRLRGQFHDFPPPELDHLTLPKTPLMPTFHPAYLLRSPGEKAKAWEDLQQVMRLLKLTPNAQ